MPAREAGTRARRSLAKRPFLVLTEALRTLGEGERLDIGGLSGAGIAWLVARLLASPDDSPPLLGPMLVVCPDERAADRLATDLRLFVRAARSPFPNGQGDDLDADDGIVRLPADEVSPYEDGSPDHQTLMTRLAALDRLRRDNLSVLVVGARALCSRLVPPSVPDQYGFSLRAGQEVERDELVRRLSQSGYQNAPLVEDPGAFATRGGIIDLWPPRHQLPVRVELFGDEIDTIRLFDPETQRTLAPLETAEVSPARQVIFSKEAMRRATTGVRELAGELGLPTRSVRQIVDQIELGQSGFGIEAFLPTFHEGGLVPLSEWLAGFDTLIVSNPADCDANLLETHAHATSAYEQARARGALALPPKAYILDPEEAFESLSKLRRIDVHDLLVEDRSGRSIRFTQKPVADLRRAIEANEEGGGTLIPFVRKIAQWRRKRRTVGLVARSPGQADRLQKLLEQREITVHPATGRLDLFEPGSLGHQMVDVHLLVGDLSEGFEDEETRLVLLSETDLLGARVAHRPKRPRGRRAEEAFAANFQDLSEGDLVVHVEHGIGRYRGLTRLDVRGIAGDFLLIEYAGKDKIYLPVHRLGLVQRYVGSEAEGVRLDRLGSQSFSLRKTKVKEELLKMAAELLDIYAARKAHPGTAFSEPDAMYREFEAGFAYEETEDQQRAIEEVLSDMQSPEPMDRLVCGDVGYGKTEVAMRAAMKAVLDGKQVVVLVPTTVLAAQHEATFKQRFARHPVIVEAVSRFLPPHKAKDILKRTAEGKVDILIGTHRLLSRDLEPKDLGLLIIDEEQRFGVAQKERLKKLRRQVDVMTLTATPIPRTLHMSLSGIRDLSIIATPPPDRRATRTFVSRFDGETVREAVLREMKRGGQVFFVHNRVRSIGAMSSFLSRLLPEARIIVAHGQMSERALERAMSVFLNREADLLLSSAIIESGLDMPSVNTIIVNRADTFGLAQLYQLRGRVGRSSERAYAYLLVPARRPVSAQARKRLAAIQQLTDLGSGFRLATHDLEIRGAGSLLGKEQSGRVAAVGFDLYTELLEEAVCELKGEAPKERLDPEVNLPIAAFLPEDYVADVHQRLILYKRLAKQRDRHDLEDIRSEIIDRYGPLPAEAEHLLCIRNLILTLERLGIKALESGPGRLVLTPGPLMKVDPSSLLEGAGDHFLSARRRPGGKFIWPIPSATNPTTLLEHAEDLLARLEAG